MNDPTCIWTGSETPRALKGRHLLSYLVDEQGPVRPGEHRATCRGCQPCTGRHCLICGIQHVDRQTCPECIGAVRDDLRDVLHLTEQLPQHAAHGGVNGRLEAARAIPGGEATVILAPGAENGDALPSDPTPTLLLLGTWEDAWRHELGQPAAKNLATIDTAAEYLAAWLPTAAQSHPAFDEFASDLRRQVSRLEAVLHAGEHSDQGAPCVHCGADLERVTQSRKVRLHCDGHATPRGVICILPRRVGCCDRGGAGEVFTCPRCHRRYTEQAYHYAVGVTYRAHAPAMTAAEIEDVHDIKATQVRVWGSRGLVAKRGRNIDGLILYDVEDALERHAMQQDVA